MSRRRAVIEYGVAIDLVVVAAGVGLLYPTRPVLILVAFIAASTLSAWKGWGGAAVAIVLSTICQLTMFPAAFPLSHVGGYIAAAATGLYRTSDFRDAAAEFKRLAGFARGEEDLRYYNAVSLFEIGRFDEARLELACALPFIQVTDDVSRYRSKIEQMPAQQAMK